MIVIFNGNVTYIVYVTSDEHDLATSSRRRFLVKICNTITTGARCGVKERSQATASSVLHPAVPDGRVDSKVKMIGGVSSGRRDLDPGWQRLDEF